MIKEEVEKLTGKTVRFHFYDGSDEIMKVINTDYQCSTLMHCDCSADDGSPIIERTLINMEAIKYSSVLTQDEKLIWELSHNGRR